MPRVLHVLSQRPLLTGSGVTLDAIVREAHLAGWEQAALVGVPAGDPPGVGALSRERVFTVSFAANGSSTTGADVPFGLPGMSDVMPYATRRFSSLDAGELDAYRHVWRSALARVVAEFRPDLVHAHHVWLVSSLLKDVAPAVPLVLHGHGTDLRQAELCPHLSREVRNGCSRADRLVALHAEHSRAYARFLDIPGRRIDIVGAGYREEVFPLTVRSPTTRATPTVLYAGKLSEAKGVPSLLDAMGLLAARGVDARLEIAGGGEGEEADSIRRRLASLPRSSWLGRLEQGELAGRMRRAAVFVLPSFYEGLPLVLVEALASGCRLVATDLPGVRASLIPHLGDSLETVAPPRLVTIDTPDVRDLPRFAGQLAVAIERALHAPPLSDLEALRARIAPFTWRTVFGRIEAVWLELLGRGPGA